MKHKIGDKVKVRSKEWWNAQPKNEYGNVKCGTNTFVGDMTKMCGEVVTISEVFDDFYSIKESVYRWTDEMFEDEASKISENLLQDIANVIKSHNLGVSVSAQDGKLIIEPLTTKEDLAVDTPCMVRMGQSNDAWYLRYYAGNKKCFVNGKRFNETPGMDSWDFIIPWGKFNPNDIEESLKYNIVK